MLCVLCSINVPEIIALIILIGSVLGIAVIALKKISILASLPIPEKTAENPAFLDIKNLIGKIPAIKPLSLDSILQKMLSKTRVFTMKAENKTANWLQKLREKSKKSQETKNDNYWDEIKNSDSGKINSI